MGGTKNTKLILLALVVITVVVLHLEDFQLMPSGQTLRHKSQDRYPPLTDYSAMGQTKDNSAQNKLPVQNIFYLKIHKCSSSTMQGMFARYAIWYNLTTVTLAHTHTFPHPALSPFVHQSFPDVSHYNMLTSHIVFSENQIRQLLPKDAKFLTILREPFSLLQSEFKFFDLCKRFRMPVCQLSVFLDSPEKYDKRARQSYVWGYSASFTKNFMARHLGFDDFSPPGFDVSDWIEYIDERFDFIGLMEYLPESLVYIRRLLNWSTKDVLSLSLRNETLQRNHPSSLQSVNQSQVQELKDRYRSWSPVDHRLYDHFYRRFHEQIQALGDDFQQEVQTFKTAESTVFEFCSKWCPFLRKHLNRKVVVPKDMELLRNTTVHIEETAWSRAFFISLEDCILMMVDPDSIRRVYLERKQQQCSGAKCRWYLGHSLPTERLKYLTCIGNWAM